ncbi:MAG: FHA domain-containing protein [Chloroflexi bacterium]|nr:MAG: FHA domain-containing protein [Chloroflexota bacterium]
MRKVTCEHRAAIATTSRNQIPERPPHWHHISNRQPITTIGRDNSNDITNLYQKVSRFHARLIF